MTELGGDCCSRDPLKSIARGADMLGVPTNKRRNHKKIIRESWGTYWNIAGNCRAMFMVSFYGKICLKTAANYSASFWSYNFRFAYGRTLKPSLPRFRDFRTCFFLQNQLCFSLERPGYHNTSKKTPESCSKNICLKIRK